MDRQRFHDVRAPVPVLVEEAPVDRDLAALLAQAALSGKRIRQDPMINTVVEEERKSDRLDQVSAYLLDDFLGGGGVALPKEVVPADAGGVAEAGELDGDDLLVVGALEPGCWLRIVHDRPEVPVLDAPGLHVRRVVLSDAAADRVPVHRQDLDRFGVASFLVEHHQEVVARLDERPRDVVPGDSKPLRAFLHPK